MKLNIEKNLASWWKRILIFSGLVVIFYLPLDYIFRRLTNQFDFIYYYYDFSFSLFISLIITSILIEGFRSGRNYFLFGLHLSERTGKDIFLSFLFAFVPFILLSGLLYLFDLNKFTGFVFADGFLYFIIIIFIYSANEELIFRGILFQSLLGKFGIGFTVIFSSLLFASFHIENYNFNYMSFLNTFLAGIVLGIMYIQTKSLYLPIFYHFFWNLLQQFLLDSNISGNSFIYSISQIDYEMLPVWLFGGYYGIEGGLIGTLLLLLAAVLVLRYAKPSPFVTSKHLKREISESIL